MAAIELARTVDLPQDTGWRDITDLLEAGYDAQVFQVRRIGSVVWMAWRITNNGGSSLIITLPPGLRPATSYTNLASVGARTIGDTSSANSLRPFPSLANGESLTVTFSYITNDPWPSTLPGTPA